MVIGQYMKIALNFAEAREKANKSQQDVANFLNITAQAVSNWENGRSKIDSVSLLKCLLWFGEDIYEFLGKCDFDIMEALSDGTAETENFLISALSKTKEQPADVGELSANEEKFFKALHAMPDDQRSLALALCTALVKELVRHQRVESETKELVHAGSDH